MNPLKLPPRPLAYLAAIFALWLVAASPGLSAQDDVSEYQVKAVFLYKFINYVEWPAGAFADRDAPIVFGVIGAEALADNLEQILRGREINGRSLRLRRLRPDESPEGTQVLFIDRRYAASAGTVLQDAIDSRVLTVTEAAGESPAGSVINFIVIDNKVKFNISLTAAERAELYISSRLLALANEVSGANP